MIDQECIETTERRMIDRVVFWLAMIGIVWYAMGGANG